MVLYSTTQLHDFVVIVSLAMGLTVELWFLMLLERMAAGFSMSRKAGSILKGRMCIALDR